MRKLFVLITVVILVLVTAGTALAANGPAPQSGDGVPDGSGLDSPFGANVDGEVGVGPAPNSGDGVSDGSGF